MKEGGAAVGPTNEKAPDVHAPEVAADTMQAGDKEKTAEDGDAVHQ